MSYSRECTISHLCLLSFLKKNNSINSAASVSLPSARPSSILLGAVSYTFHARFSHFTGPWGENGVESMDPPKEPYSAAAPLPHHILAITLNSSRRYSTGGEGMEREEEMLSIDRDPLTSRRQGHLVGPRNLLKQPGFCIDKCDLQNS